MPLEPWAQSTTGLESRVTAIEEAPPGNGAAWRDGSGAPSSELGANGDYYLNSANGDVYKKTTGTYSQVANIQGAAGATGSQGSQGTQGTQGIQGLTGNTGSQGPQGVPGADGAQGIQGEQGPQGDSGAGVGVVVTLDFGAGDELAVTVITGQSWVTAASVITATAGAATADHDPEDAILEEMRISLGDLVVGDGFTVYGHAPYGTWGQYKVNCAGAP